MYAKRIESFNELPHDKRPPRYMWDRSHELQDFLDHVWDKDGGETKTKTGFNIDFEGAE